MSRQIQVLIFCPPWPLQGDGGREEPQDDIDDDHTLYSVNPAIPYPKKSDQNTLVIRGRVLGVVASSDKPNKDDLGILEELFVDEIREFYAEYGLYE